MIDCLSRRATLWQQSIRTLTTANINWNYSRTPSQKRKTRSGTVPTSAAFRAQRARNSQQFPIADEPEEEADQNRREGRQPWALCRVSDGRSGHSQKSLCRHSADDRGTAAAARCIDSVMRSAVPRPMILTGEVRLDEGRTSVFQRRTGRWPEIRRVRCQRSGSALFEERKGGRIRLKPRAIWGMSAKS
jgi:hypothetical protein